MQPLIPEPWTFVITGIEPRQDMAKLFREHPDIPKCGQFHSPSAPCVIVSKVVIRPLPQRRDAAMVTVEYAQPHMRLVTE